MASRSRQQCLERREQKESLCEKTPSLLALLLSYSRYPYPHMGIVQVHLSFLNIIVSSALLP